MFLLLFSAFFFFLFSSFLYFSCLLTCFLSFSLAFFLSFLLSFVTFLCSFVLFHFTHPSNSACLSFIHNHDWLMVSCIEVIEYTYFLDPSLATTVYTFVFSRDRRKSQEVININRGRPGKKPFGESIGIFSSEFMVVVPLYFSLWCAAWYVVLGHTKMLNGSSLCGGWNQGSHKLSQSTFTVMNRTYCSVEYLCDFL